MNFLLATLVVLLGGAAPSDEPQEQVIIAGCGAFAKDVLR